MARPAALLIIACGAIAHELMAVIRANGWQDVCVQCLPADLHNTPQRIPAAIEAKLEATRGQFQQVLVAYADCGTGGLLDPLLARYGVQRLPGAHCYEFFSGSAIFHALAEAEPGSFYLTDFLVRHFERLVIQGLGLDKHPQLLPMYFGHYRRVVYLVQRPELALRERAQAAATRLGLAYVEHYTGFGELIPALQAAHQGLREV